MGPLQRAGVSLTQVDEPVAQPDPPIGAQKDGFSPVRIISGAIPSARNGAANSGA
jgi:hypothetical protein